MRVLGIETSCDETGVAIYDSDQGLLAHHLYSQIAHHLKYGGVVPEIASRDHLRQLAPMIEHVLAKAKLNAADLDAIAYTAGPGLNGALLVGASVSKALAFALQRPAIAVHHMEGHLLAVMLEDVALQWPFVALLVSGGHTQLVAVNSVGDYTVLGDTLDDAAGEAFDKTARVIGLTAYPGGPAIAAAAEQGDATRFNLPRPMTNRPGLDFSFSGLKTQTRVVWEQSDKNAQTRADLAACFQLAVVDTLVIKAKRALKQTGFKQLVIAGGVGANKLLRSQLQSNLSAIGAKVHYPRPDLCTDNAAMIAYTGWLHLSKRVTAPDPTLAIDVFPRWRLDRHQHSGA